MRNVLKYVLLAGVIVAMPVLAQAADKVGVVNSQDVVANSEAGKRASQELQSKFEAKQKEFTRQGEELKKAQEDLSKKGGVMSAEARQKEQAALDARIKKFMEDQNSAGQMMNQEKSRIVDPVMKLMEQVVADYAKKNGFSVIIERQACIYVGAGTDVTADISKEFEAASKRGK